MAVILVRGIIQMFPSAALTAWGMALSRGKDMDQNNRHHNTTHGMSRTKTYKVWQGMLQRCDNPNAQKYETHGGRGIKVCDRWRHFPNFYQDMGACPGLGFTIDRVDNDGDYEPGNCRWATYQEQNRNKRDNVVITFAGQTKTLPEWAEEIGIGRRQLWQRLYRMNWSIEKALTTPKRPHKKRR